MPFFLLKEDGGRINLEDGSGFLILELSPVGPLIDYGGGGSGRPVRRKKRRNETEALYRSIEHALEVALGLVEVPLEGAEETEREVEPAWSESRFRSALERLERLYGDHERDQQRLERLYAMLRAYEEAQERQRIQDDEEETWFLMA